MRRVPYDPGAAPRARERILLSAVIVVSLLGIAASKELPRWVTNPPESSEEFLYGVGEGADLESAADAALGSIAGSLRTRVESSSSLRQSQAGHGYEERYDAEIRTQVEGMELSHYRTVESADVAGRVYALVELSRRELIASTLERLRQKEAEIEDLFGSRAGDSLLRRWLDREEPIPAIGDARSALALLVSLDPFFDRAAHEARLRGYERGLAELSTQLRVFVDSDPSAKAFARELVRMLGAAGLRATLTRPSGPHARVRVEGEVLEGQALSSKTSRLRVSIVVQDERGDDLPGARREHMETGASLSSHETALRLAANKLASKCEQEGVLHFLGLEGGMETAVSGYGDAFR